MFLYHTVTVSKCWLVYVDSHLTVF